MESMSLEVSCGRSWLNHFLLVGKFDLWRGHALAYLWPGCIFREKQTQKNQLNFFFYINYRWFFLQNADSTHFLRHVWMGWCEMDYLRLWLPQLFGWVRLHLPSAPSALDLCWPWPSLPAPLPLVMLESQRLFQYGPCVARCCRIVAGSGEHGNDGGALEDFWPVWTRQNLQLFKPFCPMSFATPCPRWGAMAAEQRESTRKWMEGVAKKKKKSRKRWKTHTLRSGNHYFRWKVSRQKIVETPGGGTSQIGGSAASGHQHEAVSSLPLPAGASHPSTASTASCPPTANHCTPPCPTQPSTAPPPVPPQPHCTTTFFKVTQAPLAGILLSSSCNEWWTVPCSVWGWFQDQGSLCRLAIDILSAGRVVREAFEAGRDEEVRRLLARAILSLLVRACKGPGYLQSLVA